MFGLFTPKYRKVNNIYHDSGARLNVMLNIPSFASIESQHLRSVASLYEVFGDATGKYIASDDIDVYTKRLALTIHHNAGNVAMLSRGISEEDKNWYKSEDLPRVKELVQNLGKLTGLTVYENKLPSVDLYGVFFEGSGREREITKPKHVEGKLDYYNATLASQGVAEDTDQAKAIVRRIEKNCTNNQGEIIGILTELKSLADKGRAEYPKLEAEYENKRAADRKAAHEANNKARAKSELAKKELGIGGGAYESYCLITMGVNRFSREFFETNGLASGAVEVVHAGFINILSKYLRDETIKESNAGTSASQNVHSIDCMSHDFQRITSDTSLLTYVWDGDMRETPPDYGVYININWPSGSLDKLLELSQEQKDAFKAEIKTLIDKAPQKAIEAYNAKYAVKDPAPKPSEGVNRGGAAQEAFSLGLAPSIGV